MIRLYLAEKTPEMGVLALRIEHVGRNRFGVAWKGKPSYAMGIVNGLYGFYPLIFLEVFS